MATIAGREKGEVISIFLVARVVSDQW